MNALVSIIVPTYNEAENIPELLERIDATMRGRYLYEVITVDDNSPDGTAEVARKLSSRFPVKVVVRQARMGLSSAVVDGFKNATERYRAEIDADLQHPPEVIPDLIQKLEERYQVAIASRYIQGGGTVGFSYFRRIISKGAAMLGWIMLPQTRGIRDVMSNFFAIRRELALGETKLKGFKILLEILSAHCPEKVAEVPYVFQRRKYGKSKLTFKEIISYVRDLYRLRRIYGNCNKY
jgi:dolichol-phosphate mannosyltransferase